MWHRISSGLGWRRVGIAGFLLFLLKGLLWLAVPLLLAHLR